MRKTLSAFTIAAGISVGLAPPGAASPVQTGCPTAYEAKSVTEWAAMGYPGPGFIDAEGNGNGIVCGKAMPEGYRFGRVVTAAGGQPQVDVIYVFVDDDNRARR